MAKRLTGQNAKIAFSYLKPECPMKVPRLEAMRRTQAEHHRSHPWQLSQGGLFIPHNYEEKTADSLTGWDDVGFILNGRRVIVWFQHPRYVYGEAVWDKELPTCG